MDTLTNYIIETVNSSYVPQGSSILIMEDITMWNTIFGEVPNNFNLI